jgi:parallel beta-helix repeat protein
MLYLGIIITNSMNRKVVAIWLSLVMMLSIIIVLDDITDFTPIVRGTILYVNETGSGGAFTKIQDAINASKDGDTIFVYNGTYYENVIVDKRVNLIGNGSKTTIIDGGWQDHQDVVTILVNRVNMSGFRLINSYMGHEFGGIGVHSSENRIFDNYCLNNLYGLILWGGQNRICNNSFSNNQRDGIFVKSSGNIIENNTCSNSFDRDGIWLYICTDNIVSNNTCSNNGKNGISFYQSHNNYLFNNKCNNSILYDGILIYESSNNTLWKNTLSSNKRAGFALSHFSDNNTLTNNHITENQIGVRIFDNCSINSVHYNNVILNTLYGIYLSGSSSNRVHHNNIIDNENQAYDDRSDNYWDDGYPSGGNYWSDFDEPRESAYDDYQGPNQDNPVSRDGIVDNGTGAGGGKNPYVIDSDSNDNYPLISPSGNFTFLCEGWNLISIPLIQSDTTLGACLSSITGSYDAVQWYNISDSSDHWKHIHISKPAYTNDMETIDHIIGFWIQITVPGGVLFEYTGTQPMVNQTIILHPGWNMVGYPSLTNYYRTDGLNNLTFDTHVDSIWTYNSATQKWKELDPSDYFELGRGYWIHAKVECEWEVPM